MTETKRPATPPGWLNSLMAGMLHTPGLERVAGRSTALLTYTGRRSGTRYTIPVSYARQGHRVVMIAHAFRTWWRNLEARPAVRLRLAGADVGGTSRVLSGAEALPFLIHFYEHHRTLARASGVSIGRDGVAAPEQVEARLPETVVVVVDLDQAGPA